jgi:hypothetical protein
MDEINKDLENLAYNNDFDDGELKIFYLVCLHDKTIKKFEENEVKEAQKYMSENSDLVKCWIILTMEIHK